MPDIFEEFSRQVPEGVLPSGLKQKAAKAALGGTAALATAAMGYDPREVAEDAKQLAQALKTEYVEPLRQYMPENMRLGVSGLLSDPAATASYRGGLGLNIPGLMAGGSATMGQDGLRDYAASLAYSPPSVPGMTVGMETGMDGMSRAYGSYAAPVPSMGGQVSAQVEAPFSTSHVGDMLKNITASLRFTGRF